MGFNALNLNSTGNNNTGLGTSALYSNTTGFDNTAVGFNALNLNTSGYGNTAVGLQSLENNSSGYNNVAIGVASLGNNEAGSNNTSVGTGSLVQNINGQSNTSMGTASLGNNIYGSYNSAIGTLALINSTTSSNTAVGYIALASQTTGEFNTGLGTSVLASNQTGTNNTAVGLNASFESTISSYNTSVGSYAMCYNDGNTSNYNTVIGYNCGNFGGNPSTNTFPQTSLVNCTLIGANASPLLTTSSNEITLGDTNITTLRCATQSITSISDARDKTNIEDLPLGIDFVNQLKPVKFEWKTRKGSYKDGSLEAGFIAQDLKALQEETNNDWLKLVFDENPDRLEATPQKMFPILVKAIQELSAQVQSLQKQLNEKS